MRLNWFQPPARGARRFGRAMHRLGPTFVASPVRRIVQAIALLLFCGLFFWMCWPYGDADYAAAMQRREKIPAESFLMLDPLLSLSTAVAAQAWIWALAWGGSMLAVCLLIPRGFCGYLCPLGTIIDLVDWSLGQRISRFRIPPQRTGWWIHLKYYLLAATLVASTMGVLVSGFVAAIPVVTRGLQFTLAPLQLGLFKGFYLVPPMNAGQWLSIAMFVLVLALGLLRRRFWCRYVCPTGAIFSIANWLRLSQRRVTADCTGCGKCVRICPFDPINADYSTRPNECTFCQTCGGVCPAGAIEFVPRWEPLRSGLAETDVGAGAIRVSRRGVLAAAAGGAGLALGVNRLLPAAALSAGGPIVRPPGSVPEEQFLQLCIRCGECFKACPNNVLQPVGLEHGLDALWTPKVVADWSGCEQSCNNCGQVCPTGAIRPLPIAEKRAARMGLAVIDQQTCLPYAGSSDCRMCVDECVSAGYNAIEFRMVGVELDGEGLPAEGSGRQVPVVLAEACIGCGLCQTRCRAINVKQEKLLRRSAIVVVAGEGKEDRIAAGSYLQLRQQRNRLSPASAPPTTAPGDGYLPDFVR